MLAHVLPILNMYGRCYAKVWQMACHYGRGYGHLVMLIDVVMGGGRWNSQCGRIYDHLY